MVELIWVIPLLPLAGFLLNGLAGLLRRAGPPPSRGLVSAVGCGSVALSFMLSVGAVFGPGGLTGLEGGHRSHVVTVAEWIGPLELSWSFLLDPLSSVMILIVTGVGLLIHIYSIGYMWEEEGYGRYFAYLNLFMAMMLTLVLGASLPMLFVGWEGVGLCSYLLIGFYYTKTDCADAGRKAFIVNRIGDASFIVGMLLAWLTFGTFDIVEILESAPAAAGMGAGLTLSAIGLLLFGGACGKSAQIPLYVWLPDAMAGPTPVSALIHAATMVTAGVYMICRMAPLFVLAPDTLAVVAVVGAATALLAAVIAMAQDDIKKVLAYSTISQLGYMFLATGVGAFGAAIFHLTTHAFFKALLFLGSGAVIHALHGEQDMQKMGGLRGRLPRTYLCFVAGWIAIAGVPLTSGFFSKDEILYLTFLHNPGLWIAGIVGAAMTAIYMTRLMGLTFFGASRVDPKTATHIHEAPATMSLALVVLAVLSLAGGLMGLPASWFGPSPFARWLHPVLGAPESVMMGREHHGPETLLMVVSSLVALGGIAVGYYLWVTRPDLPNRIAQSMGGAYRFVKGKLYVDELYDSVLLKPYYAACRGLGRFDVGAVDGMVNGVATLMETSGHVMKLFHSGFVRNYALFYLAGAAAVLWYLVG
ncbi:MAG TPA: NADH-quinone oxidoreductase subunit L [Candidatus Polarisedimenticolia bacterium]|nr:NADH-quinone oxidoreductase subunit L [Candidatus Polarisedimenticolia bacterium]